MKNRPFQEHDRKNTPFQNASLQKEKKEGNSFLNALTTTTKQRISTIQNPIKSLSPHRTQLKEALANRRIYRNLAETITERETLIDRTPPHLLLHEFTPIQPIPNNSRTSNSTSSLGKAGQSHNNNIRPSSPTAST
jgi:hypothetical protein